VRTGLVGASLAGAVGVTLGLAAPAEAAWPGADAEIAYVSTQDGNLEIYTVAADGSGQVNLTNHPARDQDPSWSPDGSRIAWSSSAGGAHQDIWVMNADGSQRANYTPEADTTGAAGTGVQPSWSPDGSAIAFASNGDVWVTPDDPAAGATNLTEDPALPAAGGEPAWSPDGTQIAYVRGADIWVMNADGTGKTQLTTSTGGLGTERAPDWSPDGAHLVCERSGQIWRMRSDGTRRQVIAAGADQGGTRPAWSPSGTKIVFSSSGYTALNGPDLFFMNPDGTDVQRLPMPAALADTDPTWRPATPTQLLPTYLTLGANGSDPVNVSGELFPAHAGATIKVTLSERVGGVYQRVATRRPLLDAYGAYATSFPDSAATQCKLVAKFVGDADHRPSSRVLKITC